MFLKLNYWISKRLKYSFHVILRYVKKIDNDRERVQKSFTRSHKDPYKNGKINFYIDKIVDFVICLSNWQVHKGGSKLAVSNMLLVLLVFKIMTLNTSNKQSASLLMLCVQDEYIGEIIGQRNAQKIKFSI